MCVERERKRERERERREREGGRDGESRRKERMER